MHHFYQRIIPFLHIYRFVCLSRILIEKNAPNFSEKSDGFQGCQLKKSKSTWGLSDLIRVFVQKKKDLDGRFLPVQS